MKKVLLVGYDYCYEHDVAEKYKDVLFVVARNIDAETPERRIALVGMFDAILVLDKKDNNLSYEVAAIMLHKEIISKDDYPVEERDICEDEEE